MKTSLPYLLLIIGILSCSKNNFEKEKEAVKTVMDNQAQCWSKGDLEGYMDGYWKSDSLRFLGRRGLTKGWQTTFDNYKNSYPNRQTMGNLKFDYISFEPLNDMQMFIVGKWALEREKDTLSGYYSLLWKKMNGQWKIIFDHTN